MTRSPWLALGAFLMAGPVSAGEPTTPTYHVVTAIAVPDGRWDLLNVDPASERLYLAQSDGVLAIDLATSQVAAKLVPSNRGHDALPIPGTTRVLSTSGGDNTVTLFEGKTGAVIATLPVGTKPDAAAWDPATKLAWVMTPGSGDISVIDPVAAKVVATVTVGGSLELGAADGHGRLYVNVEDKNEIAVIDTRARKVISRFPLTGCDGPTGIAWAADAGRIVSACANGVAIVSAPDGKLVASLKIGQGADGAAYDARRHVALIPSGGDGTLSVIRLAGTPEVIATVPTAKGARTIGLNSATGRVYLPAADYLPVTGSGRPPLKPGSFRVLVLAPAG